MAVDERATVGTVTEAPPDPASHWSGRQVAEVLAEEVRHLPISGVADPRRARLQPHQVASWLTSHDPGTLSLAGLLEYRS